MDSVTFLIACAGFCGACVLLYQLAQTDPKAAFVGLFLAVIVAIFAGAFE